ESNPPLTVYDASGPYTDPKVHIDIRKGLPEVRRAWIDERQDTEVLSGPSSIYGQERLTDPALTAMRFELQRPPRRALEGLHVSQIHIGRKGSVKPEMGFVAIRDNMRIEQYIKILLQKGT